MPEVWQYALIGLSSGSAFALVALGVVAVYRGSGILNFSQGAIGMMGSYIFWELYSGGNGSLPVATAVVIGVAVGAALGVAFYLVAVQFLRQASDMAKVVATLGFTLLLESVAQEKWGTQTYLLLPLFGSGRIVIFGATLTHDTLALTIITIVLAAGIWLMFNRTGLGSNATALREDPVAAATIGISPHPTGLLTWGLGGATGALAGILLIPVIGLSPSALTLLVIPAMAAALIGRFTAVWLTAGIGLLMGIGESVMQGYNVNNGLTESLPFAVIAVTVVLGGRAVVGRGERLSIRLPRVGSGRLKPVSTVIMIVLGVIIATVLSPTWPTALINTSIFGLLALSIVVVTGYAGQISVASAAFAGFGCFVAAQASHRWNVPFLVCLLLGTAAAVVLGVIFGAPAVRVRGINLAIVTLGLSLAVEYLVLTQPSLTGGDAGLSVGVPTLFGLNMNPTAYADRYAILCVVVLALGSIAVLNIRRGESGRRYVAVRANERGAASVGMSVAGAKLGAFAISAALAGLSGALAAFRFSIVDFSSYDVFQSISALAFTVVGGVGFVGGALVAALSSQDGLIANFFNQTLNISSIDTWLPIASGFAVIANIIAYPDGLVILLGHQKDAIAARLHLPASAGLPWSRLSWSRHGGSADMAVPAETVPAAAAWQRSGSQAADGTVVLTASDVTVRYGSTVAVDQVSLRLAAGRVTGVVGPNGAGKTSFIDALTGFTRMASGTVTLDGTDLGGLRVTERARLGIGRTFQGLELFEDLSVRENILAALDSHRPTSYARDIFYPKRDHLSAAARAAITMLDLNDDLDTIVSNLPQGRRRMVAIARLVAQEPSVMLLDEPAAGLTGPERLTVCRLFRALAEDLGAAVLLVEHNMDVVSATCDELIVLDFGKVIVAGPTADVLRDPAVRAAYLGQAGEGTGRDRAAVRVRAGKAALDSHGGGSDDGH
jgi:ABC-type branched-subunit amino acid transport system ATPase component/ABC-type branched-subunit amino acid transport system permease subunit